MDTRVSKTLSLTTLLNEGGSGSSLEERVAWYQHMQETQPVHFRPEYNLWEVFRYKDVQYVLSDADTFVLGKRQRCPEGFPSSTVGMYDPPEHGRLRGLVSKAFTPRSIEELKPRLIQIVDELLAPAIDTGKIEIVTELTNPFPTRVIAEMLGLPASKQERVWQWSYQLVTQFLGLSNVDNTEVLQYFAERLSECKRLPGNDLMSMLLAAEDEQRLTHEEVTHFSLELMWAGNFVVSVMLTSALAHLCQQPELYQALRDNPELIPAAIEETIRYEFYSFGTWRIAHHDTMLGEHQIKAGQFVVPWIGAADFDEEYFPHATQFDIRRSPNPHLMFSRGIHTCLGAPLARLEGRTALERVVTHFSELRFDPAKPVQYMGPTGASSLIKSLGVLFTSADAINA